MNYILKSLFNFGFIGRARRAEFWWFSVGVAMLGVVLRLLFIHQGWTSEIPADPELGTPAETFVWSELVVLILTSWQRFALWSRRLHDFGQTAWWLALLVPVAFAGALFFGTPGAIVSSLLPAIVVGFVPGTMSANKYGEDPKAEDRGY